MNHLIIIIFNCKTVRSIFKFVYNISDAEDNDAGDFDKPNIATQAELGTFLWYSKKFPFSDPFFLVDLVYLVDSLKMNFNLNILWIATGRLFSSGGTPDVPAKRPTTGTQNAPGECEIDVVHFVHISILGFGSRHFWLFLFVESLPFVLCISYWFLYVFFFNFIFRYVYV